MLELVKPTNEENQSLVLFHPLHALTVEDKRQAANKESWLVWEMQNLESAQRLIKDVRVQVLLNEGAWQFLQRVTKRLEQRQVELFGIAFDVDYTDLGA